MVRGLTEAHTRKRKDGVIMKFKELWVTLDSFHPLWINIGGECERFENKLDYNLGAYGDYKVEYITLDGDGELTIELVEFK